MRDFTQRANRWIFSFLADRRYRWARHLVLLIVSFTVAWSNVYTEFLSVKELTPPVLFLVALFSPIYLNVFFFTPRYLLRNRTGTYFSLAFLMVLGSVVLAMYAQWLSGRPLPGGEDQAMIAAVSVFSAMSSILLIIAGTSAFMLVQQKVRNAQRIEELENTTIRSELEQLKNQINPHFLFNMLNNANVLVQENPEEAEKVLYKLRDLLAYQFNEGGKENVLLSEEIAFLGDFLKLESIRRDKFIYTVMDMDCPPGIRVPPLLFIPFVENAVKHGNESRGESYVLLTFRVVDNQLDFLCTNSKPRYINRENKPGGLGLANIRRRLELLYPQRHTLTINNTETTYTVHLHINL